MIDSVVTAEYQTLGAVLREPSLLSQIDLHSDDFSIAMNREVWAAIQLMFAASDPIDPVTVAEKIHGELGGKWMIEEIGGLAEGCRAPVNGPLYAAIVKEKSTARKARVIAEEISSGADSPDSVDRAIRQLMALGKSSSKHECGMEEAVSLTLDSIETARDKEGLAGITSGIEDLDEVLGGFHGSDLYVIGARPSMGKTSVLINFALAANVPLGVISGEQPRTQMITRMIAATGQINANKLRNADLTSDEWSRITSTTAKLNLKKIRINDKPGISILDLVRQVREWKYNYDIQALYVDYIQRIKAANMKVPRHEQVGEVVMSLKELARELDIPVIALAQVNRNVDNRADARPTLGDLKDSGAIEQEADNVMTLYRDEVYKPNTKNKGLMEIDVKKNRHGPTGFVSVVWEGRFMRILPLAKQYSTLSSAGDQS